MTEINKHSWTTIPGSNVSFVCSKCGAIGFHSVHIPHRGSEPPAPSTKEPCDLATARLVMNA